MTERIVICNGISLPRENEVLLKEYLQVERIRYTGASAKMNKEVMPFVLYGRIDYDPWKGKWTLYISDTIEE